jgi:hypothetical protein
MREVERVSKMHTAAIIEMDAERDRKICVSLDLKVTGANRELAQWLADHNHYSGMLVAGWLGCGETRILALRRWVKSGFDDALHPTKERQRREERRLENPRIAADSPLKLQENFENDNPERETGLDDEAEVEDPERVIKNLLIDLDRHAAAARAYGKIFKVSSFDAGMKKQISEAIDRLISKWRLTQVRLARKERSE